MPTLIIVESPNKVKKVKQYAGSGYVVAASVGHITKLADTRADQLGFAIVAGEVEIDFQPNGARGKKTISSLRKLAKHCDEIILATDPDREGEAIAWHCADQVGQGKTVSRISYTEITQSAIQTALQNKRHIDMNLVFAQMSRQVLDKWIGYTFSRPLMNSTQGKCRSVGRVQSAALAILVRLEQHINDFHPTPYWVLDSTYEEGLDARFMGEHSAPIADTDSTQITDTGTERKGLHGTKVLSQSEAERLVAIAQAHRHIVVESSSKSVSIKPPAPLTTSALQQLAGSKLGYSSEQTMQLAQALFEAGLITYHRTDSVSLSAEFCGAVQTWLQQYSPHLIPQRATHHRSKGSAQGAHEAIRPTTVSVTPDQLPLDNADQIALYRLIWQRAIASQCAPARLDKTQIVIQAGPTYWGCTGQRVTFAGYTTIFNNLRADQVLPMVQHGQQLTPTAIRHSHKMTAPPSRLSEPQLVAELEKKGIGRPSTYASIMKTLRVRHYVDAIGRGKQKKLKPTASGLACYAWLEKALPFLINADFTAKMESSLDVIAQGHLDWERYLRRFEAKIIAPSITTVQRLYPGSFERRQDNGVLTNYVCTLCGHPLTLVRYQKGKETKQMLRCSGDAAHPVYFWTKAGKFWNPGGVDLVEGEQPVTH